MSLDSSRLRPLTGFGGGERRAGYVVAPRRVEEIAEAFATARRTGRTVAMRGAGRSYGDAATGREEIVLDLTELPRSIELDDEAGWADASASVPLVELCRAAAERGFWPPVVTGTGRITLGGAVAMNVHGKNDALAGPIGEHVLELDVVLTDGSRRTIRPEDAEFDWIFGSAGTLAVTTRVRLRLDRVAGWSPERPEATMRVRERPVRGWAEGLAALREGVAGGGDPHLVIGLDHFACGSIAGRGIFQAARLEASSSPPPKPRPPSPHAARLLAFATNRAAMRLLNGARVKAARNRAREMDPFAFSFQLDAIPGWERAYGPAGFFQLQTFVPAAKAEEVFEAQREALALAGREAYLSVLKVHRADRFPLSPNLDGFSLALDLPASAGVRELMVAEQERTIAAGGRLYLAKDATLTADQAHRMLGAETIEGLRAWKARLDPEGLLRTDLSRRLRLGGDG